MRRTSPVPGFARRCAAAAGLVAGALAMGGCFGPSRANIKLRKQNQALQDQVAALQEQNQADLARITGFQEQRPTVPTLPQSRLDQMYTVHGIQLGRLSGGANLDPNKAGDQGLKIFLTPVDQDGEPLKATGHVTVEALDLAQAHHMRVGEWEFSPAQMKQAWRSFLSLHAFVLVCPWQTAPRHPSLTIHVTFRDELTGRVYSADKDVTVILPSLATRPATQP